MSYEIREISPEENIDFSLLPKNTHFTQSDFYANWQRSLGRFVGRYAIYKDNIFCAFFQVIEFPLIFSQKYLYIPYGPVTNDQSKELILFIKDELKKILTNRKAVFVRLDFNPTLDENLLGELFKKSPKATYHSATFQPRTEWHLDISKKEADLLAEMEKDTRYSVRTSLKREVKTEIISNNFGDYFEDFYSLMKMTAERNKFGIHKKEYYRAIFDSLPTIKNSFLSVAKFEGKNLVIDLMIAFGDTVHYVFGASSDEERKRLPSYSAIWNAIKYSKEIGYKNFSFGGISSKDDSYSGWKSLTEFKRGWGGGEVKYSDFYDIVEKKFWYYLYCFRRFLKSF